MLREKDVFFEKKEPWSLAKDQLLRCCLRSYFQRICFTGSPLLYADLFAGKGRFDDGQDGSPLTALKTMKECCQRMQSGHPVVEARFIESQYASELKANLSDYHCAGVISDNREDAIANLLAGRNSWNVFLYLDPRGIRNLKYSLLLELAMYCFSSVELLIVLNSFEFIRAASRVFGSDKKVRELDKIIGGGLAESQPMLSDASDDLLMEIAGGDYWEEIVHDYCDDRIDSYQVEKRFAAGYAGHLAHNYQYVLNVPVSFRGKDHSDYRMIHATNSSDGCLSMCKTICKRKDASDSGRGGLLPGIPDSAFMAAPEVRKALELHIRRYDTDTRLSDVIAGFVTEQGIICSPDGVFGILQDMKEEGAISMLQISPPGNSRPWVENWENRAWIKRR